VTLPSVDIVGILQTRIGQHGTWQVQVSINRLWSSEYTVHYQFGLIKYIFTVVPFLSA